MTSVKLGDALARSSTRNRSCPLIPKRTIDTPLRAIPSRVMRLDFQIFNEGFSKGKLRTPFELIKLDQIQRSALKG